MLFSAKCAPSASALATDTLAPKLTQLRRSLSESSQSPAARRPCFTFPPTRAGGSGGAGELDSPVMHLNTCLRTCSFSSSMRARVNLPLVAASSYNRRKPARGRARQHHTRPCGASAELLRAHLPRRHPEQPASNRLPAPSPPCGGDASQRARTRTPATPDALPTRTSRQPSPSPRRKRGAGVERASGLLYAKRVCWRRLRWRPWPPRRRPCCALWRVARRGAPNGGHWVRRAAREHRTMGTR